MYIYTNALCLTRTVSSKWIYADLGDTSLCRVFSRYSQTFIIAHDTVFDKSVNIKLEAYRTKYATSSLTVTEWLTEMSDTALETVDTLPDADLVSARYENAILRNYKIEPTRAGFQYPPEMSTSDLPDLALTRPLTDVRKLHTHCLLSVNGYYHRSDADNHAAYIIDGNVTAMKKRCSHTGILSFLNIGQITQFQLSDENIIPLDVDGALGDGLIIRLPEEFRDKSKLFILGGYMVQNDIQVLFNNDLDSYVLYPRGLPLVERYFESRHELDLSSIELEAPLSNKDDAILVEGLYSDANIRAWLKLSQSFIAVIDTPVLYFNHINVRVSTLPGFVTAYQEPVWPLVMGYGKHPEYSKVAEGQFWALRIQDPHYKQFTFQKAPIRIQPVVTDQYIPWRPYSRIQGYLLEISAPKKSYN